jgi:hypothetical protein
MHAGVILPNVFGRNTPAFFPLTGVFLSIPFNETQQKLIAMRDAFQERTINAAAMADSHLLQRDRFPTG